MRPLILAALALTFFPRLSSALEITRWKKGAGMSEFWIEHDEGGRYFVEHFSKNDGELQERLESRAFPTRLAADREFKNVTVGFIDSTPRLQAAVHAAGGPGIWTATHKWSTDWEAKYRTWIESTATAYYLSDHGVATDCADVAYAYRWIFARLNALPMSAALAGTNEIFTNMSMRPEWTSLPTDPTWDHDQRFMTALNYLLDNTFTHTLMGELYPVAITREQISGGAIYLNLWSDETGHTQMVRVLNTSDLTDPGPLRMLASDVPRAVRVLNEYAFESNNPMPADGTRGFFRFRWPGVAAADMPGYSTDEFSDAFTTSQPTLLQAVLARVLPGWNPDATRAMQMLMENLEGKLKTRVNVVVQGSAFCQANDCSPGTLGWEDWSTPARDRTLVDTIHEIYDLNSPGLCDSACKNELYSHLQEAVTTINGKPLTLVNTMIGFDHGQCSADPRDPIAKRWGL